MEIPKILKKYNRKYLLDKTYKNFARYTNLVSGVKECFLFHDLGIIQETAKEREAKMGGTIKS